MFSRIFVELILRNTVEGERPVGFASYREIGNDELYGVLKDMELANLVRGKSSREILLITGIYAREENTGDSEMIRDAAQQLLVEVVAKELEKNYSFALFVAERGTAAKHVVYALERQGFVRPHLADENDKRTIYLVDMHEPLMFLHNLETTTFLIGIPVSLSFGTSTRRRSALWTRSSTRITGRSKERIVSI